MAFGFSNRVWVATGTIGTGDVAVGLAKPSHVTPDDAGTPDGDIRSWVLEEGSDFEIFRGAYNATTKTVQRGTVIISLIGGIAGTARMNLAGTASLRIVAAASDIMHSAVYDPQGKAADAFDSANIDFLQAGTGAVTRNVRTRLRDWISAKDFDVKGDGSTDDTTNLNKAIAAATGKRLILPSGTYKAGKLIIPSSISFEGDGPFQSIIASTEVTDHCIEIQSGVSGINGPKISGIGIYPSQQKTAGFCIAQTTSGGSIFYPSFSDIQCGPYSWGGISLVQTYWGDLQRFNVQSVGVNGIGVKLLGSASNATAGNLWFDHVSVNSGLGGNSKGLLIDSYSEGLYFNRCTFESSGVAYGVHIQNSLNAADSVKNIFMSQVVTDSNGNAGLVIEAGRTITIDNSWFAGAGLGRGISVSNAFDIRVVNSTVHVNQKEGIFLADSANSVLINGCSIVDNSIAGSNLYSAIQIYYNACDITITNNQFARALAGGGNHKNSVEILGGSSERIIVTGNNLRGWNTSAIADGAASTNKVIANNILS